ncbi:hypothetical protein PoB_000636100 [Plakobranchus ocellatus]|uniref:Uncharacterized protein n=1 Tax=Plakobranchus ocellatus TaxID=259542 RepID=A0AAV3YBV0_9GAST|nr:hypothetical protein PoB_000636100 [Plakobranchus ocellatus]
MVIQYLHLLRIEHPVSNLNERVRTPQKIYTMTVRLAKLDVFTKLKPSLLWNLSTGREVRPKQVSPKVKGKNIHDSQDGNGRAYPC